VEAEALAAAELVAVGDAFAEARAAELDVPEAVVEVAELTGVLVALGALAPPLGVFVGALSGALVGFLVGAFDGALVAAFVGAGAGWLFTGAAPGGSAPPPFCHENARKPPLGTLIPLTPEDA
jgi:hypothetical protein